MSISKKEKRISAKIIELKKSVRDLSSLEKELNDLKWRRILQTAMQNDQFFDEEEPVSLDWILYKIRLGSAALRVFSALDSFSRSTNATKDIPIELYMRLVKQHISKVADEYDRTENAKDEENSIKGT